MLSFELVRINRLIKEAIQKLELNLENLTILTEVGSNSFLYLPIIAAMANAKQVYAWAKDSSFGKSDDIINECQEKIGLLGLDGSIISFASNHRSIQHIANADVITNSATIRPLDESFLKHVKASAVIPLMFEKWELRDTDIDINYCRKMNIKVAGTWENHPDLLIFNSVGNLALKMIYDAGLEIWQNNIFVWGCDEFGKVITGALTNSGANSVINSTNSKEFEANLSSLDILYLCDYHESRPYFTKNGDSIFNVEELVRLNPSLTIVHLFGNLDSKLLLDLGLNVFPRKDGFYKKMSYTLNYIGPKTTIDLYAAGLKVATEMLKGEYSSLSQQIVY